MALDHIRLGREDKINSWKTIRPNFCFRQVYFTKSCQQINQPLTLFIHHIWGETVLFIIRTSGRMQYFTIFQDTLHPVNIQDDQLCETVQKISKITYMASQFSLLTSAKLQWTLIELRFNIIENLLCLFFYFRVFQRCVILKCVWYARHFELTPASNVHERLKTNDTAIKIARETTNNQ